LLLPLRLDVILSEAKNPAPHEEEPSASAEELTAFERRFFARLKAVSE